MQYLNFKHIFLFLQVIILNIHPPIHYLTHLFLVRVAGWCWSLSQRALDKRQDYAMDRSPICRRAHTPFTPKGNVDSPVNLTCMYLDCGRKRAISTQKAPGQDSIPCHRIQG
uniref:Uncharacterized protein n=1 Tax=Anguilla anguilla TaxID=7936 RepID=A0A0E9WLK5_ANGAN